MSEYNREALEELYRRKEAGFLSVETQNRLKEILRPIPPEPKKEWYAGPSQNEVIQLADTRKFVPSPGWTEEKIAAHPNQYAAYKTINELAKIPGTMLKEAGQMAIGAVALPAMAWWELMSIADRNIQPTQEDVARIAQENKVSPQTVIESFKIYNEEKMKTAPDYSQATKEILKDWIKPYTSLDNFIKEAPKRPLQIILDATIVGGLIKNLLHTGAKLPQVVKALRGKGLTNEEIKVGIKLSANNLKVKQALRESTIGHEKFGKLSTKEMVQAKFEKIDPLASELLDDIKTPVQAAIAAQKSGRTKIAKIAADEAIAKAKKVKAMDGPTTERFINEQLGRLPKELKPILGREAGAVRIGKGPKKEKLFNFSDEIVEKRYQRAKGIKKEGAISQLHQTLISLKNKLTRDIFEHLPRTGEFMPLRNELLRLQKAKGISSHYAVRTIQEITKDLDRPTFDLFTRKVILDDLLKTSEKGMNLPLGFTSESLLEESSRLDTIIKDHPKVLEALNKRKAAWNSLRKDYTKAMKNVGLNVEDRLKNEAYFRHQILEYVNAKGLFGTGKRLRTPTGRGFLKQRKGSTLDINTDYLQAESEVVAQMLHDIKIAKAIKAIDNLYSIRGKIKAKYIQKLESLLPEVKYSKEQLLFGMQENDIPQVAYENTLKKKLKELGGEGFLRKRGLEDWRQLIKREYPEYDLWQPREGNIFFMVDSIPAKMAEELTAGKLEQIGITAKDLQKMLAVGGRRKELVLKKEIIETLNNLSIQPSHNVVSQLNKKILRGWKVWTLISPRRYAKYNLRNLSGDADAVFVGNPSAFKEMPAAINDLWQHFAKKEKMTPELRMWFDRGGFESTLQAQEMGEINNLKIFLDLQKPSGELKTVPTKVWQTYWKKARMSTDFREAILRYSAFRDYLKQMATTGGVPKNFGASIPEEIMNLADPADKAFHLSNDLLGAYDRISVAGKALREHLFPFWSWKEVNFKRYVRLFKNAANDKKLCEALGRKATKGLAKTPYQAYRVGKFLTKATALWGMLEVYNNTRFPEEEKSLPQDIRDRPHIVLGRDEKGKILYFSRLGALGDFLEWFGLDAAPRYVRQWLNGRFSLQQTAQEMARSPVNVFAQGATPLAKTPFELMGRRSLFPDVFEPGTIRDRGYYLARSLGLENEYKAIMNLPSRGYGISVPEAFIYRIDPGQGAYSDMYDEKQRFLKKLGKYGEGFWLTPKGDALYNFKLSLRYDDKTSAEKYLLIYFQLGGTEEGLKRSLESMNPLSGLNELEQNLFILELGEEGRRKLALALKFWSDTLTGEAYSTKR